MSQEMEAIRSDLVLSDDDAPFDLIAEKATSPLVDCEKSTPLSTGTIQKAAEISSEPRTAPPMALVVELPPPLDTRIPLAILDSPYRDLPTSISDISQESPMFLPNVERKALENHDQLAAEDITPIAIDLVPEATAASKNTEKGQERPKMPTTPSPIEKIAAVEDQLKVLCDKLQVGFLTPGQQPNPKNMRAMARHLRDAEGIHHPPACVVARKFLKVLKAITKLDHIPRDEKFGLKEKSKALREKWVLAFGDIVLPRREPEHIIIDLTESADESPQSVENDVLNLSETISPPASVKPPAKRKRCSFTNSSPSSPEMGRGKRRKVTKIHLKAHFEQENSVMQNFLRNVCQMIEGVNDEIELAQTRKKQLESMKDELEAWVVQEQKVTCQLEKQS